MSPRGPSYGPVLAGRSLTGDPRTSARSRGRSRQARLLALPLLAALWAAAGGQPADVRGDRPAGERPAGGRASVVVTGNGQVAAVRAAVARGGGTVTADLPIVAGVAARLPAGAVAALAHDPAVRSVHPDGRLHVQASMGTATAGSTTAAGGGGTLADGGPASVYGAEVRSDRAGATGATGAGVTVAVLDTGVSPSPDLGSRLLPVRDDLTGRVSPCENLSGEPTCDDTHGHGTFLAGLIAGDGSSSGGRFVGMAPQAKVVSIKVGGADGSADVSNVLAGIQWAVSFRATYGIRVLNLSLGTDSTQDWQVDALNYAVERAWAAGITVVVAASNRGPAPGTIDKPGDDPYVVTVGAVDDLGTTGTGDDALPAFSSRGPTSAGLSKPDVVAPGTHLVSLDAPGSTASRLFPSGLPAPYRRASGTSMSTAVVSGAAAQILSRQPTATPDRLKFLLRASANNAASSSAYDVGAGLIDVPGALAVTTPGQANAGLRRSSGLGSIDATRGNVLVETATTPPVVVSGLQSAQLVAWDPVGLLTGDWSQPTWYSSTWYTAPFLPTQWHGAVWDGFADGATQYGAPVNGYSWHGYSWHGYSWHGSSWYGAWS